MGVRILCVGQSDSCAGTGIQADIKTVQAFGGYAATAVTAVSVHDTHALHGIHFIPVDIVQDQIERVLEDIDPPLIKLGMLGNAEIIDMVGDILDRLNKSKKILLDPVMLSRLGKHYLDKEARDALKRRLLIHADVITPNTTEAMELSGITSIKDVDEMLHAAETLRTLGAGTVILKGSTLQGEIIYDVLADEKGTKIYEMERLQSRATLGAGTTLLAGIAVGMAEGMTVRAAFEQARAFVIQAVREAEIIGSGYGPLNHCIKFKKAS